ncbi:MAG: hypothetical protein ACC628_19495 [Pirellulaceae bacterium]
MGTNRHPVSARTRLVVITSLLVSSTSALAIENYDACLLGNGQIQVIANLGPVSTHSDQPRPQEGRGAGGIQLYLNSPDLLGRKLKGNLLYHHRRGLEPTCIAVGIVNEKNATVLYAANSRQIVESKEEGGLVYRVDFSKAYPQFKAEYQARYKLTRDAVFASAPARVSSDIEVSERMFCPPDRSAVLRVVSVRNTGQVPRTIAVYSFLAPNKQFLMCGQVLAEDGLVVVGNGKSGPTGEYLAISGLETPHVFFLAEFPQAVNLALDNTIGKGKNEIESTEHGVHAAVGYKVVVPACESTEITFSYQFANSTDALVHDLRELRKEGKKRIGERARQEWEKQFNRITTGRTEYDTLYDACKGALRASVSNRTYKGRMNSGFYCYEGEWVRDSVLVSVAAVMSGQFEMARDLLDYVIPHLTQPNGLCLEGFIERDLGPELDMNGQLLYAMWIYWVYSGDATLIEKHWERITRVAEFPLHAPFWSSQANMAHSTRDFWERSDRHAYHVGDAFEMVYQAWISLGLAKASEMALAVGKEKEGARWGEVSKRIWDAVLNHPKYKMIEDGHFIKRKTTAGEVMHRLRNDKSFGNGDLEPDSIELYPILLEMIDPKSDLARKTLDHVERLWNQDGLWSCGGYGRYNYQSEPAYDQPGAWPLVTMFVARAALECEDYERAERALEWIIQEGGPTYTWYEHKRYSAKKKGDVGWHARGIVPWPAFGEVPVFFVHHVLGFRPEKDKLVIRPRLLPNMKTVHAKLRYRSGWVNLKITRQGDGKRMKVNGETRHDAKNGALSFPAFDGDRNIEIVLY